MSDYWDVYIKMTKPLYEQSMSSSKLEQYAPHNAFVYIVNNVVKYFLYSMLCGISCVVYLCSG